MIYNSLQIKKKTERKRGPTGNCKRPRDLISKLKLSLLCLFLPPIPNKWDRNLIRLCNFNLHSFQSERAKISENGPDRFCCSLFLPFRNLQKTLLLINFQKKLFSLEVYWIVVIFGYRLFHRCTNKQTDEDEGYASQSIGQALNETYRNRKHSYG